MFTKVNSGFYPGVILGVMFNNVYTSAKWDMEKMNWVEHRMPKIYTYWTARGIKGGSSSEEIWHSSHKKRMTYYFGYCHRP